MPPINLLDPALPSLAPALPDSLRWAPIEEAPRDGTMVIVNDTTPGWTQWVAASYLEGDEWSGWVYDDADAGDTNPLGPRPTHFLRLPDVAGPGWLPIDGAPRDGSMVLVNDTTPGFTPWVAASYHDDEEWSGWVYDDSATSDTNPLGPQPTHYFPVPPVPVGGVVESEALP
jgi:hypothetical protein